ncbi:MAG: hypothetical protein JWN95_1851 [Frankiales bacterium]|nr:hypothetical protein [Frankiales bacterium]
MHADKTNRSLLIFLAILLTAAGALGLITGFGVFGSDLQHRPLTRNRVGAFIGRDGDWLWPVVAVVVLLIALLALRWLLLILTSTDRSGDLRIRSDSSSGIRGKTTLSSSAVTAALSSEIESYRGVHSANARLIGNPDDPTLAVDVTLQQSANLAGVRRRVETEAFTHVRQAIGSPELPIRLDLGVSTKRPARTV